MGLRVNRANWNEQASKNMFQTFRAVKVRQSMEIFLKVVSSHVQMKNRCCPNKNQIFRRGSPISRSGSRSPASNQVNSLQKFLTCSSVPMINNFSLSVMG
jgi:hypothetical protein